MSPLAEIKSQMLLHQGNQTLSQTDSTPEWLEISTFFIDSVILIVLFIVETTLFIMLKFKMDSAGKLTLLLHLMSSIIRVISDFQQIGTLTFLIMNTICNTLIWLSLYYFIFEMLLIHALISEFHLHEFNRKRRILFILQWTAFAVFIAYTSYIIYFINITFDKTSSKPMNIQQISNLILTAFKFIVDVVMFQIFVRLILFFINQKIEQSNQKLNTYNKFIIAIIALLFIVQVYQSLLTVYIIIWEYIDNDYYKNYHGKQTFIDVCNYIVIPIKDFSIALAFSALYFYQGNPLKARNKKIQQKKEVIFSINKEENGDEERTDSIDTNFVRGIFDQKIEAPVKIRLISEVSIEDYNRVESSIMSKQQYGDLDKTSKYRNSIESSHSSLSSNLQIQCEVLKSQFRDFLFQQSAVTKVQQNLNY